MPPSTCSSSGRGRCWAEPPSPAASRAATLLGWAALLAATVPGAVVATRLQAKVAIGAGWLLRRRLLHGTLRLRADDIRREGAGQLLGRSLEAEAVEDLAIGGGLLGVLAAVELAMAVVVLAGRSGTRCSRVSW